MTVWEQELCDASTQRATVHRGSLMDAEGRILRNGPYSVRVANNAEWRVPLDWIDDEAVELAHVSFAGTQNSDLHRSIKFNPPNMLDLSYSFVGV